MRDTATSIRSTSRPALAFAQWLWDIAHSSPVLNVPDRKARPMQIWPAIDLRGGKCVRLSQGDYDRETIYGDDPAQMARQFVAAGAQCLHLVDLDGAKAGTSGNLNAVRAILGAVNVPCELGGGIRDEAVIERLLALGLARLVIGTRALREPEWFRAAAQRFPDKLALGIDAKNGRVATHGWLETSDVAAIDLARELSNAPIAAIIYTDISRDGMLQGPNLPAMGEMKAAVSLPVIASGGVARATDVADLARLGMDGCIIGRALYEGTITLPEAISASQNNK